MSFQYLAKIFFDHEEVSEKGGDDVDELYSWMLVKTQGMFGNFNGEIIDNTTGKVVRRFRKSPPD